MKKILLSALVLFLLGTLTTQAAFVNVNTIYDTVANTLNQVRNAVTAPFQAASFNATSTTATSTFPILNSGTTTINRSFTVEGITFPQNNYVRSISANNAATLSIGANADTNFTGLTFDTGGASMWNIGRGSGYNGANSLNIFNSSYGSAVMSFPNSTGNVGIGSTSPSSKLSVVGQVVGDNFISNSLSTTNTMPVFYSSTSTIANLNNVVYVDGLRFPHTLTGIRQAIAFATSTGIQTVALGRFNYQFSSTLVVPNISLIGLGSSGSTIISCNMTDGTDCIQVRGTSGNVVAQNKIAGIKFFGNASSGNGIATEFALTGFEIVDNAIFNFTNTGKAGIYIASSSWDMAIRRNSIRNNHYGISLGYDANNISIEQNSLDSNLEAGVTQFRSNSVRYQQNNIAYTTSGSGIVFDNTGLIYTQPHNDANIIVNNWFEANDTASPGKALWIKNGIGNLVIQNYFTVGDGLRIDSATGTVVANNVFSNFRSATDTPIVISSSSVSTVLDQNVGVYNPLFINNSSPSTIFKSSESGNTSVGSTTPTARFSIWGLGTTSSKAFEVNNSVFTTIHRLLDDGTAYFKGNLGINTTIPSTTLHVVGTTTLSGRLGVNNTSPANILDLTFPGTTFSTTNYLRAGGDTNAMVVSIGSNTSSNFTGLTFDTAGSEVWRLGRGSGYNTANNISFKNSNNATPVLTLTDTTGNVGIGTTTPSTTLHVVGTTTLATTSITALDLTALTTNTSGNALCIVGTSVVTAGNTTCVTSSARFKQNITPLNDWRDLLDIDVVEFNYKSDYADNVRDAGGKRLGFVAEQVNDIEPQLVQFDADGKPLSVHFDGITAKTVLAIQEIQKEIDGMTGKSQKSAQDNWQWVIICLLFLLILGQQYQIAKLKK